MSGCDETFAKLGDELLALLGELEKWNTILARANLPSKNLPTQETVERLEEMGRRFVGNYLAAKQKCGRNDFDNALKDLDQYVASVKKKRRDQDKRFDNQRKVMMAQRQFATLYETIKNEQGNIPTSEQYTNLKTYLTTMKSGVEGFLEEEIKTWIQQRIPRYEGWLVPYETNNSTTRDLDASIRSRISGKLSSDEIRKLEEDILKLTELLKGYVDDQFRSYLETSIPMYNQILKKDKDRLFQKELDVVLTKEMSELDLVRKLFQEIPTEDLFNSWKATFQGKFQKSSFFQATLDKIMNVKQIVTLLNATLDAIDSNRFEDAEATLVQIETIRNRPGLNLTDQEQGTLQHLLNVATLTLVIQTAKYRISMNIEKAKVLLADLTANVGRRNIRDQIDALILESKKKIAGVMKTSETLRIDLSPEDTAAFSHYRDALKEIEREKPLNTKTEVFDLRGDRFYHKENACSTISSDDYLSYFIQKSKTETDFVGEPLGEGGEGVVYVPTDIYDKNGEQCKIIVKVRKFKYGKSTREGDEERRAAQEEAGWAANLYKTKETPIPVSSYVPKIFGASTYEGAKSRMFLLFAYTPFIPMITINEKRTSKGAVINKKSGLNEKDTFTCEELKHITISPWNAIDSFHQAGVLHNDIKPGNMLLSVEKDETRSEATKINGYQLYDFGLVMKGANPDGILKTTYPMFVGTFIYNHPSLVKSLDSEYDTGKTQPITLSQYTDCYAMALSLYKIYMKIQNPNVREICLRMLDFMYGAPIIRYFERNNILSLIETETTSEANIRMLVKKIATLPVPPDRVGFPLQTVEAQQAKTKENEAYLQELCRSLGLRGGMRVSSKANRGRRQTKKKSHGKL